MTDLRKAAEMALEALENAPIEYDFHGNPMDAEFGKQLDAAIAALRQALAQPEQNCYGDGNVYRGMRSKDSEVRTIHVGLTDPPSKQEQAEKQEPYAYIYETNGAFGVHQSLRNESYNGRYPDKTIPVYTAPPKQEFVCSTGLCHYKPWLGLTDEEVHEAAIKCVKSGQSVNAAIRSIEAKLKEKNHE